MSSDDHMQSSLVMSRPILFRQPSKNKEDGFLHPTLDCINVFPFHMVNSVYHMKWKYIDAIKSGVQEAILFFSRQSKQMILGAVNAISD